MARTKNRFNAADRQMPEETPAVKETWRVGIYARLSVESYTRPSESVENQLELMRKFVASRPEFTEIYEYTDKGYSGTNFKRPGFERMMEDIRNGKINCIIVKDLSRLGRDYLETSNYVETIFPFLMVRFISVNDHFDTNEEHNGNKEMEIALKNLVNDMYARDVSKRLSVSRSQDQHRGKFVGGNAPYGYKVDEKHELRQLIIDEPAADIVRQIYAMALDGITLREIARSLEEQKVSIPGQYMKIGHLYLEDGDEEHHWYIGTVSNILHNEAYIGNMVQGKRRGRHYKGEERHFTDKEEWIIQENTHEPIISREAFDQVQKKLAKKVADSTFSVEHTDVPIKPNPLKGMIFCGICGESLGYISHVVSFDPPIRRYNYRCVGRYVSSAEAHKGVAITEELLFSILKGLIGDVIRSFNNSGGDLERIMEKELKTALDAWHRDIRRVSAKVADLDAVFASQYEAYVLGTLSKESYLAGRSSAEEQREILEHELSQLQEKCTRYEAEVRQKQRWLEGLNEASEGELDRNLLQLLIKRIELYPKHELQITWRFSKEDLYPGGKEE